MKSPQENIIAPEKVPIAIGKEKDVEEKGEKEKNLEKYMEYVPDKREQEVRLMNMLKDQEKEEEVVIKIWTHLNYYSLISAFAFTYAKHKSHDANHQLNCQLYYLFWKWMETKTNRYLFHKIHCLF